MGVRRRRRAKRKKIVWPGGELLKLVFKSIKWGMIMIIPSP